MGIQLNVTISNHSDNLKSFSVTGKYESNQMEGAHSLHSLITSNRAKTVYDED